MPVCLQLINRSAQVQAVQVVQPLRSVQDVELRGLGSLKCPNAEVSYGLRWVLVLQVILFTLAAPGRSWSHDPTAAEKAKGAERREVRIPIEDFTLTDQTSRPFKFQSLRGKVAIVAFAYTTCPDVCPLITAAMRQTQDALTKDDRVNLFRYHNHGP